jgi:hypothetical protein
LFVHEPVVAVSGLPSTGEPAIVGGEVLAGASGTTTQVAELAAAVVPPPFVADTTSLIVNPTSWAVRM